MDYALWLLASFARHGGAKIAKKEGWAINAGAPDSFLHPTVVFDIDATLVRADSSAIAPTVKLLRRIKAAGARVHLVTARHPSIRDETIEELTGAGITPDLYESLLITPESARKDMGAVGRWKAEARKKVAIETGSLVALTIGDQWTDLIAVSSAEEFAELDAAFLGFGDCPQYILVRPRDGISALGLKLAYE